MSDFKNSTRTIQGHHHWDGGSIGGTSSFTGRRDGHVPGGGLAHGGGVDKIDSNPGHAEVYPSNGNRMHGNSATQRTNPPTAELEEHGGRTPLVSKFGKGGPAKHFHVHKHFHAKGGKTHTVSHSYGTMEKHAETYASGGHVHDDTHVPSGGPDYAKGGMHINPKHKGLFTKKMTGSKKGKLTDAKVQKGLHSKSASTRKQANFARMARRHFEPLHKNAGGALYATGGTVNKLAGGGMPMSGAPMPGALGQLAARPRGLPMRGAPSMRRPMGMAAPSGGLAGALSAARAAPAPTRSPMVADPGIAARMGQPLPAYRGPLTGASMMARGGPVGMRTVAKQEVARHVRTAPPRGHGVK